MQIENPKKQFQKPTRKHTSIFNKQRLLWKDKNYESRILLESQSNLPKIKQ